MRLSTKLRYNKSGRICGVSFLVFSLLWRQLSLLVWTKLVTAKLKRQIVRGLRSIRDCNCTRQPKRHKIDVLSASINMTLSAWPLTSVRELPACIKAWKILTATLKCICKDSLTNVLRVVKCIVVVIWTKPVCFGCLMQLVYNTIVNILWSLFNC